MGTGAQSSAPGVSRAREPSDGQQSAGRSGSYGRLVFGIGAVFCGFVELIGGHPTSWQWVSPALELVGGIALAAAPSRSAVARRGAWALALVYLWTTLQTAPEIVRHPLVFATWGDGGEQLARLAGAVLVCAFAAGVDRVFYWAFVACVFSFMGEQMAFFARTTEMVPHWIPPTQRFWALATMVLFGLGALGLAWTRTAPLASRLLTAMLLGFAVLVYPPLLQAQPHSFGFWLEAAETLSIAGAAWVVSDYVLANRAAAR